MNTLDIKSEQTIATVETINNTVIQIIKNLEKLEKSYTNVIRNRMSEQRMAEAIRLQWKKDGIKHAIAIIKHTSGIKIRI